jgi:glycosyltransferase involved in cell wall biosynthesis
LKIIYHHRTRGDGAEGIHIGEMINAFETLGHRVQLVCPATSKRTLGISLGMTGLTAKESRSKWGVIKLYFTQFLEVVYNLVSFLRLAWNILRTHPDFVYERYSCYHFGGMLACWLLKTPSVLEVNSTYAGRFQRRQLAFPRICRWIESWVLRRSNLVCVVSNPLRLCVMDRHVPTERIVVTPNAVNPKQLASDPKAQNEIRRQLQIKEDTVVIGFVGSLRRWHGIEFLVDAIPAITSKYPNCIFLIVGTGELEKELRNSISKRNLNNYVRFTGGVPYQNVPLCIRVMDIGLQPDSNEWCSPMKILEYMLQGKPVVAPRIENIEEIVQQRHTGILFERLNLVAFESAILELLQSPMYRQSIGENARRYVLSERTWTANAKKVLINFLHPSTKS